MISAKLCEKLGITHLQSTDGGLGCGCVVCIIGVLWRRCLARGGSTCLQGTAGPQRSRQRCPDCFGKALSSGGNSHRQDRALLSYFQILGQFSG
jgi:hypothetical protein